MAKKLTRCKVCGAAIASNAKACPSCGAKASKPIYKKWWFYAALFLLLVVIVPKDGSGKNAGLDPATKPGQSDVSGQSSTEGTDKQPVIEEPTNVFAVGDTLETSNVKLSYQECEADWKGYSQYIGPKDGCKIVRLYFAFENTGSTDTSCGSWDFSCYADGISCDQFYFSGDNDMSTIESISPGRKLMGNVYFEVPKEAEKIEIEYETSYWTQDKAIFIVE